MKTVAEYKPAFDLPVEGKVFAGIDPANPGAGLTSFKMIIVDLSEELKIKKRIRRKNKKKNL